MRRAWFNDAKVRAEIAGSGAIGHCPFTNWPVRANVGEIRQYWSYIGGQPELPPGYENETPWHAAWKLPMEDDSCEVIFGQNNEHRADIVGNNGTVIELQHSPIDIRDVRDRINFYNEVTEQRVVWIVDAREYWNKTLKVEFDKKDGQNYPVTWKNKRHWTYHIAQNIDSHLYLDYNIMRDTLLKVWVHERKLLCKFVSKKDFFMSYFNDVVKNEYKDYSQLCINVWNDVN